MRHLVPAHALRLRLSQHALRLVAWLPLVVAILAACGQGGGGSTY